MWTIWRCRVAFYQTIFGFELIDSSDQLWAMSVVGCQVLLFGQERKGE